LQRGATRRNEAQHGLNELDRLTEQWVADHLQRGKTSKKRQELVTLEFITDATLGAYLARRLATHPESLRRAQVPGGSGLGVVFFLR
jgi:hypothetical protein